MLTTNQISAVIEKQNNSFLQKNFGLKRSLLSSLRLIENFALIIIGIRRCGKSTLLFQLMKENLNEATFINFEDTRLVGFETDDFQRLIEVITQRNSQVLFFDEIQHLENWELFVRQLLDEQYQIVITGSNATLLSKELGTKLTGRHLSTELFPFSYKEFLQFKNLEKSEISLNEFLFKGGFPEYLKNDNGQILNQLLDDLLNRDIAVRYGIRDINTLKKLTIYLISNIGKPVSGNKLKDLFNIKSASTILEFFSYLENAYVIQFVSKFDYSKKTQIRNPKKVYTIDMGLFTQNSIVFTDELGRRLENAIFLHLRISFKEIYYFQLKNECDFVIMEKGKVIELVQVCYEINEDNKQREIKGLIEAMNFFKVNEGKIITFNQKDTFSIDNKRINLIPAWEFMG